MCKSILPILTLFLIVFSAEAQEFQNIYSSNQNDFLVSAAQYEDGSFIFGGGLLIIPLLEFDVVERLQWLTQTEFINGVAIGQLTPGPVVLTAAFVGFKVAGELGALVSAIAIFLPSFAFIMLAAPLLIRIRQNPWIRAFLRGVTSAVLGAIAAAAIPLAQTAIVQESGVQSVIAVVIAVLALVALIRYKTPTWQLVPAGAAIGLIVGFVRLA